MDALTDVTDGTFLSLQGKISLQRTYSLVATWPASITSLTITTAYAWAKRSD